jgi:predicted dehydrogenase
MDKLNVLIVGGGVAGSGLHLPAYQNNSKVNLVGFCDTELAKKGSTHPKNGLPVFADLADAVKAKKIDIVDICTPPQTHLPVAKLALDLGCKVLVEKPLTFTFEETKEVLAYAESKGGKLAVVHQNKFLPGILKMKQLVQAGETGDILQLDMAWLSNGVMDRMSGNKDFWCHTLLGGRFAETLPHQLYCAYELLGEMRLLDVQIKKMNPALPWMKVDEANVVLESKHGFVNIRLSTCLQDKKRVFSLLHGTKRTFLFNYSRIFPLARNGLMRDLRERARSLFGSGEVKTLPPHYHVINRFVDFVRGEGPSPTPVQEAYHVMKLTHEFGELFERKARDLKA